MNDHERIEELVAARALGGLDDAARRELEELQTDHGTDCTECARFEREYGETAGRLAFAVSPEEVPSGMEDELVQRVVESPRRVAFSPRRWLAGVAAAVLLVGGGVGGYLVAPRSSSSVADAALRYVSQPGVHVASLQDSGPGTVTLAYRPGSPRAYLVGSYMEAPPSGHVYELWLFHGSTPTPAGTFTPSNGAAVLLVQADASTASVAAITLERAPGAQHPTTKPIFSATLQ